MIRKILFVIPALLAFVLIPSARAQTLSTPKNSTLEVSGLSITPFLVEAEVGKGQHIQESIEVSNTTNQARQLQLSINDFVPNGPTGQVRFLASSEQADPHFSLNNWIEITSQPKFTIPAHGSTEVTFSINPPVDADDGTHYGGMLFSYSAPKVSGGSEVTQQVATLIIVKTGVSHERGRIVEFKSSQSRYAQPDLEFTTTFSNEGNAHLKPKGKIHIYNLFGQEVGLGYINENAQNVLPQTNRTFISQWRNSFMVGRYTAEAVVTFGNPQLESRATIVFWVLPWKQITFGLVFAILVIGAAIVGLRRYNRWIIARAHNKQNH